MSKTLPLFLLIFAVCFTFSKSISAQYGFDTITVYFDIGKNELLTSAIKTLDSTAQIIKVENRKMLIYGYADYLGSGSPNQTLSNARAQRVYAYLLKKQVPKTAILQVTGVGQVNDRGEDNHGNHQFRKVEIFLKRTESAGTQLGYSDTSKLMVQLKKAPTGSTIVLEDVFFHYNSSRLTNASFGIINDLLRYLQLHPKMRIGLEGHVCCVEKDQDAWDEDFQDIKLSRNRARTIFKYLVENGIEKERVSYRGYGKSQPLVDPEITETDKTQNRRVAVRILKPL